MGAEELVREYRALVNMNALGCQPSFVPMPQSPNHKTKSKSNASKGTQQSRDPFRVSATGSPRYTPRPDSPAMTTSPLVGSRIPRKSPGTATPGPGHAGSWVPSRRSAKPHFPQGNTSMGIESVTLQVSTHPFIPGNDADRCIERKEKFSRKCTQAAPEPTNFTNRGSVEPPQGSAYVDRCGHRRNTFIN
jgi:hypothetical protein